MRICNIKICIDPVLIALFPIAILTIPMQWLLSWCVAVLIHELGHCLAIHLFHLEINSIKIGLSGAIIQTGFSSLSVELFCALSGPMASLLLMCVLHIFPRLAVVGFIHGMYNLIPIYPFDGGRAMKCVIRCIVPARLACRTERLITLFFIFLLGVAIMILSYFFSLGLIPVAVYMIFLYRSKNLKTPCKSNRKKVQ